MGLAEYDRFFPRIIRIGVIFDPHQPLSFLEQLELQKKGKPFVSGIVKQNQEKHLSKKLSSKQKKEKSISKKKEKKSKKKRSNKKIVTKKTTRKSSRVNKKSRKCIGKVNKKKK